jgi:hypothetical protein
MVEGSTGGAGLRGLGNKQPTPLTLSVLSFNSKHMLQPYDNIGIRGLGRTHVTLERHIVKHDPSSHRPTARRRAVVT